MKRVRLTRVDYEDLVYPAMAIYQAPVTDLRKWIKIMDKIESYGTPPTLDDNGRPENGNVFFRLPGDEVTIRLEDAEAAFVVDRLEEYAPNLQAHQSRHIVRIVDELSREETATPIDEGS